jgi:two-component system chemotaxis response regulator CheY
MRIYQRAAEYYFQEKLRTFANSPNHWRAIYFEFSHHPDQYAEGLRTNLVVNIIKEFRKDQEGHVYLMDDGDLAILMTEPFKDVFEKLGEHIAGLLPDVSKMKAGIASNEASYCSVYDLSLAFNEIMEVANAKHQQLIAREAGHEKHAPEAATKKRNFTFRADAFANATINRGMRDHMVVMVIEDDALTRRLVANVLNKESEVIEAEDGVEALEKYVAVAPDMVLLDIELPDINGHLVLQEIIGFDPDAFVVMLSGISQKENVIAALVDGAQGFVIKPFAKEKLMHYLKVAKASKAQRLRLSATAGQDQPIH